jgi:hypothetical protein
MDKEIESLLQKSEKYSRWSTYCSIITFLCLLFILVIKTCSKQ